VVGYDDETLVTLGW